MELSNEQRELLSAYLDGEVSAAERALAQALLQRPEAASYVEGLKRVRSLAQQHGGAQAPRNFAALVRQAIEGDFDGISRPTSNQGDFDGISRPTSNQLQLNAMPQASWRMPLFAAAAAILLALGMFAVNALWQPEQSPLETAARPQQPSSEVAAGEALRDKSGESDSIAMKESAAEAPESLKKAGREQSGAEGNGAKRTRKATGAAEDAQDHYEEKQTGDFGRNDARSKDDDRNAAPEKRRDWREPGNEEKNDKQENGRPQDDPKPDSTAGKGSGVGGGAGGGGGARGGAAGKGDTGNPEDAANDVTRRVRDGGKVAGPPEPPARPPKADAKRPNADTPAERSEAADEEVVVTVTGARNADSPSLATDALAVAAAYGEARAGDDTDGSTLEVEVDAEQLEEMIAALRKVAQGSPAQADGSYRDSEEAPAKARDYLPSTLRGAEQDTRENKPARDEAEKADEAPKPQMAKPAGKRIRVRVKLR